MAAKKWVIVASKHCQLIDKDVELTEQRVYPTHDFLLTQGTEYQVHVCSCSAAVECNMVGVPCRWAYTNPDAARF